MTAKLTAKKKATKKKATRSAAARTSPKKKAVSRKGASAAPKTAKKKTPKKTVSQKKAKAAASGRGATKTAGGRTVQAKTKRKVKAKTKRRRPRLNVATFRSRLTEIQSNLLQSYLSAKGNSRSRESDGTEDYIDYAVSSYDREFLLSLTELEQQRLKLVEEALKRIDKGGYGLCVQCERPIRPKRLEVQPWARYCVRCQELADAGAVDGIDGFPADDDDTDDLDDLESDDDDTDGGEEAEVVASSGVAIVES